MSNTECSIKSFEFHPAGSREVVARFDGGTITSEGGALLLREAERRTGMIRRLAGCFRDSRNREWVEHPVEALLAQRIHALALGYEDLNDHDALRRDPLLAVVSGKADPLGQDRRHRRDKGKALAGKSTLNRLELAGPDLDPENRYRKIVLDFDAVPDLFVDFFLEGHDTAPERIVLDLDATDSPLHGEQEGRFFHGYYKEYCYLPLYIFCGEFLLCAKLRQADKDAAKGSLEEVQRIVARIRQSWPNTQIILRGDSGFCRDDLMAWCEAHGVDYLFGLAKNARLIERIPSQRAQAEYLYERLGVEVRVFADFTYQTLDSWTRERRVVGKAEHLDKGANPRFVVTSLPDEARHLYEDLYCARGEMENRIKEQQLYMFADRMSAETMRANQIRMWFSAFAYMEMHAVRRLGLAGTAMEKAQCSTIRLKLLKIGAQVKVTVRKVWVSLSESYPYAELFARVYENLRSPAPLRC